MPQSVETVQGVETSTYFHNDTVEFDLGRTKAIQQAKAESAQATRNANKFAVYALMGEEELAALPAADLQAYKNSESKKRAEYEKRGSPSLMSVKLRLAQIDRAKARREGKL